jgi:pimeloyl-ACP methyl ester carboxylesterase
VTTIPLTSQPEANIEAHACELLSMGGAFAFHLENALPRSLAGLAYWDEIFEPLPGAFTNPFQMGPLDLFWPDFAEARSEAIARRTAALREPGAMHQALARTFERKAGVANRMVSWRHFDETVLAVLLRYVPEKALLALAQHVIRWPYRTRTGFPDLTVVYGPNNFEFVEVKGPTDQLQPGQRVWLKALNALDLPARVLKFKAC